MLPDLQRLIQLQRIDSATERARQTIEALPARLAELEAQLAGHHERVEQARTRVTDSQTARRALEKDAAIIESRLSRYREQLMQVKTNREYHAMQTEITGAEGELKALEDRILERLLEADELTAAAHQAEAGLAGAQAEATRERDALAAERRLLELDLDRLAAERTTLRAEIGHEALALFDAIARARRGVAVAEARDGLCSVCHVRLRPQVFNSVRRNEALFQCDSCHRILFFLQSGIGDTAAS